jgi:hypothetical protein
MLQPDYGAISIIITTNKYLKQSSVNLKIAIYRYFRRYYKGLTLPYHNQNKNIK